MANSRSPCWLAASIAVLAAGCMGSSSHATPTAVQAQQRLADLGLTGIGPLARASYGCDQAFQLGPVRRTGRYRRYAPSRYAVAFRDRKVAGTMMVIVFQDAASARACADGARFAATHSHAWQTWKQPVPYRSINPTTVETGAVAAGTPTVVPGYTGEFQTAFTRGPVLAMANAGNLHDSTTLQRDLTRAAAAIAG